MFMLILALTSMQTTATGKPVVMNAVRAVEREVLSTEGFLSNSKFVVTKKSTSYDVNTKPACFVRHCDEANQKLAFTSCKVGGEESSAATEWNVLGVKTMERFVSTTSESLAGLSEQLLNDSVSQFANAVEASHKNCWTPLFNWALVLTKRQDYEQAIAKYLAVLELVPESEKELRAIVHLHLGLAYELAGKWTEKAKQYDLVRSVDPQVEIDYWGVATTTQGRKYLSNYGKNEVPLALVDLLLYKHFSAFKMHKHSLLAPGTQDAFIENRYSILKHVLPPFVLHAVQTCANDIIKGGSLKYGDGQADRYVMYNDRISRFIHYQITDLVRNVIAHNARPSYTYFGGYRGGAKLSPHTDRHACEFTMSLNVQQFPHDKPWTLSAGKTAQFQRDPKWNGQNPARLPDDADTVNADLFSGDALLFMGRHLVHFRRGSLPEGHWTNQVFLHYVQEDFAEELA